MRTQFVPIPGSDIICNARFERPGFARSEVGHLPGAGEDVVCFPMMLVPEGGFGSGDQMHVREAKSHIVRLGQHAERARLAVGGDQLVAQLAHLICTLDEKAAIGPGALPVGRVAALRVVALVAAERRAEDADMVLVLGHPEAVAVIGADDIERAGLSDHCWPLVRSVSSPRPEMM